MKMSLIALLFFVKLCSYEVESLQCYQCTSINNTLCGDPFGAEETLYDCPVIEEREPELCRKLRQVVDTPNGKIIRITRSCGYIRSTLIERDINCFKASFTAGSSSRYCACETDKCNSSDTIQKTSIIIIMSTVAALLVMK